MAHIEVLSGSKGLTAKNVNINISSPAAGDASKELERWVTAAAIHDSAERCDAPKCHEDTRIAVQDDLYDWILKGDPVSETEQPRKIKWVTGPAGCGKTAIMGSLSVRCASNKILGATFFFASWSATPGRRRKTTFVTTIARQLAMYREDLRTAISNAIEKNPTVFEKNLHTQMEILVSAPLREVAAQPGLQGAIIIDGVDECEAEQYHDQSSANPFPMRTKEQDQLEILQVLQAASSDPFFPFRILIASRPERVFRDFFDPENTSVPFAHKLDLHEQYNADADITLFLEAQFNRLRRRYKFPPSWPPPGTITKLVENASSQFVYAATVIRLLDTPHREPPEALLRAILEAGATQRKTSSPLEQLDALYARILESSPNPRLSVQWIRSIKPLNDAMSSFASNVNLLLQTDLESNEAEHLLGNLHSLIQIPLSSGDQATTKYGFYHKSLFDFLKDRDRSCGSGNRQNLYFEKHEIEVFMWDKFVQACMSEFVALSIFDSLLNDDIEEGCNAQFPFSDSFLAFLASVPRWFDIELVISPSKVHITPAGADWWVSLAITHLQGEPTWQIFQNIHTLVRVVLNLIQTRDSKKNQSSNLTFHLQCSRHRQCKQACRTWSSAILRRLGSPKWIAPGLLWPSREGRIVNENKEFYALLQKAIPGWDRRGPQFYDPSRLLPTFDLQS
ncbi:hypothetical protein MD484_g9002, partial [Candolleomyces efflorescens]